MVVASGSWVKNVATYPTPAIDIDMVIPTNNNMNAKAILTCRPNSHPFQERTLTLDHPMKIGRSVARARPTSSNAIFDCKVLSRHHALLWYDNGKFFLQDTKSSNGTFVNNNKLSTADSDPHEVSSGDIVQFGVDVVENNRRVTHCCIVATLKLYLADGKEAKASPSITESNRLGLVPLDELYKLNQIIQEACHREQCLENKLLSLQQAVEDTRKVTDESWQAYIGEERLLSRVSALESQLTKCSKNILDDKLREELNKLQEEKVAYQLAAKESLTKLHAKHLEAIADAVQQERAKASAEQEANLAKDQLTRSQKELEDIALQLVAEQKRANDEKAHSEQREQELQARLESESQEVNELHNKLEQFRSLVNNPVKDNLPLDELEKNSLFYPDDTNYKEEMLANETQSKNCDESQGNHHSTINTLLDDDEEQDTDCEYEANGNESVVTDEWISLDRDKWSKNRTFCINRNEVAVKDYESVYAKESPEHLQEHNGDKDDDSDSTEKETGKIDSNTLKYQFQSLESELKRQIDQLQQQSIANVNKIIELEKSLTDEKRISCEKNTECNQMQCELVMLTEKWNNSCFEIQQMQDVIASLRNKLDDSDVNLNNRSDLHLSEQTAVISTISNTSLSAEQIGALEEELVILKELYAVVNEDKLKLNKSLNSLQDQYNALCNRSHNTMFFYIAPLVLIVLYLLINQYFS